MFAGYIYASYVFTFGALVGLIVVSFVGLRAARQRLAALQDGGDSDESGSDGAL